MRGNVCLCVCVSMLHLTGEHALCIWLICWMVRPVFVTPDRTCAIRLRALRPTVELTEAVRTSGAARTVLPVAQSYQDLTRRLRSSLERCQAHTHYRQWDHPET